jgi:hypothetical protein
MASRLLALRWVFLAAALLLLARFALASRTARTLAACAACGLAWALLSRRKACSLDAPQPRHPW